ncbi:hypothetical protein RFI_31729 [Reticulomyxa filosa]|uniref:Uncharacterized protein n=1 Tax=Reticulomyxa filosa TaxID=46433 RepID=X6LY58_RETFI|nr:hypothetical protein RFI_31729 [Reticulomyxa filosa]|eukprot:ETO05665.1 hypothetical protein RFI_31729 [Reticulomyxa filosa]
MRTKDTEKKKKRRRKEGGKRCDRREQFTSTTTMGPWFRSGAKATSGRRRPISKSKTLVLSLAKLRRRSFRHLQARQGYSSIQSRHNKTKGRLGSTKCTCAKSQPVAKEDDKNKEKEKEKTNVEEPSLAKTNDIATTQDTSKSTTEPKESQAKEEKPDFTLKQAMPVPSPLTKLLAILQRELLLRANTRKLSTHSDVKVLEEYILKITQATILVLTQHVFPQYLEFRVECLNIISNCFISKLFLPLLTALSGIVFVETFREIVEKTWQDLIEVLHILDDLSNMDPAIANELSRLYNGELLPGDNSVLVESPHSYLPNTLDEKLVSIPGANYLVLQFDERCNTERGQDYLQLCLTDGTPICSELHGPPNEWNSAPLIIPHNEIIFRFTSGLSGQQSQNYWGYACLVTGIKFGHYPNHSAMFDLLHTTANAVGRSLRSLMVGREPNDLEKAHSKWLESPLFSKGREMQLSEEKSEQGKDDSKERERREQEGASGKDKSVEDKSPQSHLKPKISGDIPSSPSWSPVVSHQSFLEDLAVMKTDSKAADFARKMFDQLKKEATDRMGGKVVDQTISYAIAALLKHLGLVEIARKFASGSDSTTPPSQTQNQWNQKLLFVFKLAKRLRQWIINEKQSLQQNYERMVVEAKEKGDELSGAQMKEMEDKATYEGLCHEMIEKAKFLLSIRPYCRMYMEGITSDEELPDFSFAVQISKLQSLERHASSTKSELDSWKAAFSTWQTLNSMLFYKKQRKENQSHQMSLPDLLVTFLQSSTPLQTFLRFIETHQTRGLLRSNTLHKLLELTDLREDTEMKAKDRALGGKRRKSLRSLSAKVIVLREWCCPLREFGDKDGPKTDHFLSHIESCGETIERSVRKNWEALYDYFTHLIKSADVPLVMKQQALNSWGIVLTQGEEGFVSNCKLIDLVHDMLAQHIAILQKSWSMEASSVMLSDSADATMQSTTSSLKEKKKEKDDVLDKKTLAEALLANASIDWKSLSPYQKDLNLQLIQYLHTLLAIVLIGFNQQGTRVVSPPTPDNLNLHSLQIHVLRHLHDEVRDHIHRLSSTREASHGYAQSEVRDSEAPIWDTQADIRFVTTGHDHNFLQIEEICHHGLVGIRTLTYSPNPTVQAFLKSKDFLQTLVQLTVHGSPRIKRTALTIFRDILQIVSPKELTDINILEWMQNRRYNLNQSETSDAKEVPITTGVSALQVLTNTTAATTITTTNITNTTIATTELVEETASSDGGPLEFINHLFETAGTLLVVQDDDVSKNLKGEWSSLDHTLRLSAEVKRDLGLHYVILLRALIQTPQWKELVKGRMYEILAQAPKLIDLEKGTVFQEEKTELNLDGSVRQKLYACQATNGMFGCVGWTHGKIEARLSSGIEDQ